MSKLKEPLPAGNIAEPSSTFGTTDTNIVAPDMIVVAENPDLPSAHTHIGADPVWKWPPLGLGQWMTRRQWYIQSFNGITTLEERGIAVTETTPGLAKFLSQTANGDFIVHTTSATSGSDAGLSNSSGDAGRVELRPHFTAVIETPATISSMRMWIGLFSATPMASTNPTLHGVGFRYSTDLSGNLQGWANDNSGTGATAGSLALAASTRYELGFAFHEIGRVTFYVNGRRFGTLASNLPAATAPLSLFAQVRALAASSREFRFSRLACHQM